MSDLKDSWIYNLIPQEQYELAFDIANGNSISHALKMNVDIDVQNIFNIQELLELSLLDILSQEENNEKQIVDLSQKIYSLLIVLPFPNDEIEKIKHIINVIIYSYMGEQWESGRRFLLEYSEECIVNVDKSENWNVQLFKEIYMSFLYLVRKENWKDLTESCNIISELRVEQKKFELEYLNQVTLECKLSATYELMALYHVAKVIDVMACFMINGEQTDIREQVSLHFTKAIEASEEGNVISLNLMLRMLELTINKMISNSIWMVTQRVNSRVTKFVKNITKQERAVFELMYPQKHAILEEGLLDPAHKAIVVNLPTSSGKTLIAQFRILQALNQFSDDKGWVVYIAPNRALVNQVALQLSNEFGAIGIKVEKMCGAIEIDSFEENLFVASEDKFDVLVVTPEKMNLLIREKIEEKIGRPLALAVVDEAHNLEDKTRGINLEILLANIKNDCSKANFLLLTPFIKNSKEIAKWLDNDSPKSIGLEINWKPNNRIFGAIFPKGNGRNWDINYRTLLTSNSEIQIEKDFKLSSNPPINYTRSKLTKTKLSVAVAKQLIDRKGILVIARTVSDCWEAGHELSGILLEEDLDEDIELVKRFVMAEYGEEFELVKLLSKGIAVHHSGLSEDTKFLIEWLMSKGKLKVLIATTTIAQGINFPVSTIIMASYSYPYTSEMPIRDFWNLVGRAGRAGQNDIGIVGAIIGLKDTDYEQEFLKLASYVRKSTEELVSQLYHLIEETINIGEEFNLSSQFFKPEWSQFMQYITHMFNQCQDLNEFEQKSDLFLRRTLGYSSIKPEKQKVLLMSVKEYGEKLNENKGLAKLSDSTGFSMESLSITATKVRNLGVKQDILKGTELFKNESGLKEIVGIMMTIPEIKKSMEEIMPGRNLVQGDTIAKLTSDWVNGNALQNIASEYFGEDENAIANCCKAIYSKLVNSATWGISSIQKLSFNDNNLSEDEKRKISNIPAMIYYGVNSEEAILMRMNNIPRSIAKNMGEIYKKDVSDLYEQSSSQVKKWIDKLPVEKWNEVSNSNKNISGKDYRRIWNVLNGSNE